MAKPAKRDHVLSDYAAVFRALLPQAQGFACHDRHGRSLWSEGSGADAASDDYHALLKQAVRTSSPGTETARITVGLHQAHILRLESAERRALGTLTVFLDDGADLRDDSVADRLGPALRSLQRELSLRVRLLDGQRKLQVQAAEERLLHQVEKVVHGRSPCQRSLTHILDLCRRHLEIDGMVLVIPDKRLVLIRGGTLSVTEAEIIGDDLTGIARKRPEESGVVSALGTLLWRPVYQRGQRVQGILAFQGRGRSGFSRRRLARVARYVGSQIEAVLDRNFDALTGLLAWPALEAELVAAGQGEQHSVMFMDIDQIHVLNDSFGREAGDEVLSHFADTLREVLPGQPASRMAGDNFVALLRDTDLVEARRLGELICARFREKVFTQGDKTHRPTVSIGVAPLCVGDEDPTLGGVAAARVACQAAKERGRGRVDVYESTDASIIRRAGHIQLIGYVRSAIENGRLALVGQRLMPLRPGRVPNYFEVLVRVLDDAGRYLSPADFISAAERYQLMEELDRWVVNRTLQHLAQAGCRLRAGESRFAINLSGHSLGSDSFLPFVEAAIRDSGVAPGLITFEITESVAVARMQQAQAFMQALRRLGCRFSLDDFGTGLSSFGYLKLFPVDTLKIDGSFVRDITSNAVSQSVVAAVAEVARVMQLDTVAEYVQSKAALQLLRDLNIGYAQGHLVGAAQPLDACIAAIDAGTLVAATGAWDTRAARDG